MENQANKDLVITRVFNASRNILWETWTNAEHLKHWWGLKVGTISVCKSDAIPGGVLIIHMQMPDGQTYIMSGAYTEVVKPERLAFFSASTDAKGTVIVKQLNTVLFEDEGNKTKITIHISISDGTPEAIQNLGGMGIGINQGLDKLVDYLNDLK